MVARVPGLVSMDYDIEKVGKDASVQNSLDVMSLNLVLVHRLVRGYICLTKLYTKFVSHLKSLSGRSDSVMPSWRNQMEGAAHT